MRAAVQRDGAKRVHVLKQNQKVIGVLDELRRIRRLHDARHAREPAIRSGLVFGIVIYVSRFPSSRVGHGFLSGGNFVYGTRGARSARLSAGSHVGNVWNIEKPV